MGSKGGGGGGIFSYADGTDKVLMFFGTLGSIGDGLMSPLTMIALAGVIDQYSDKGPALPNDVVDKV